MDYQRPIYAFLGPEGTNTWHVWRALCHGKRAMDPSEEPSLYGRECSTNSGVVEIVDKGEVPFGIVPLETLRGTEITVMDAILEARHLALVEELRVPIRHALIAAHPYKLDEIEAVRSHEQALLQCAKYLAKNLPNARRESRTSTMFAIEELKSETRIRAAAIGDKESAKRRGLLVLREDIHDNPLNTTRFLNIMHTDPTLGRIGLRTPDDGYKTAVVGHLRDQPGAVRRFIGPLEDHGLNMTKIESRPTGGPLGEYLFWVEFEGHAQNPSVAAAIEKMRECAINLRCLGSFGITHIDPWGEVLLPKGRKFYYPQNLK